MKEIRTEIVIEAPRKTVWQVLMDFDHYADWNPFIIDIKGKASKGEKLATTMLLSEKERGFKPTVMEVEAEKRFEWKGKMPLGAFSGQHYFKLEDAGNGHTKLIHGEHFSGWLRKIIMNKIGEETHQAFIAMNRALAEEAVRRMETGQ